MHPCRALSHIRLLQTLYSCSADGWCSEWSISAKQCRAMRKFRPSKRTATVQLEINPAGTLLACGKDLLCSQTFPRLMGCSGANNIKIIDLGSLQAVAKLRGHATPIRQMRFSANGKMLYSIAHNDRVVNAFRSTPRRPTTQYATADIVAEYHRTSRAKLARLTRARATHQTNDRGLCVCTLRIAF